MNIVLIAMDFGPSSALRHVEKALIEKGHAVTSFFGNGQPFPKNTDHKMIDAVHSADRVLIGISSTEERSREELEVANIALTMKIPFGFFCNTFGEFRRPWFQKILKQASFLFVVDQSEKGEAKTFAPKAQVVASGNPDWATYFTPPIPREQVRSILGIGPDEKMVLVCGSKEIVRNMLLFSNVAMAADEELRVFFSRHPGERNSEELYGDILKYAGCRVEFLKIMKSNEAIAGSDLVISSLSAIGITAACQRIPVIDWVTSFDQKWWKEISGFEEWPPMEYGASAKAENLIELQETMENLLDTESMSFGEMTALQKSMLSPEMFRDAAKIIADTLVAPVFF